MPTKTTSRACCRFRKDGEDGPRMVFVDRASGREIAFVHASGTGRALEQALCQHIAMLAPIYPCLTDGSECIRFSGTCAGIDGKKILINWDGDFSYVLSLGFDAAGCESREMELSNARTDCRHLAPNCLTMGFACRLDGDEPSSDPESDPVAQGRCIRCERYKPRSMQFPITVGAIDVRPVDPAPIDPSRQGALVKVTPCADNPEGKSYLGIYLGDLPAYVSVTHSEKTGVLTVRPAGNPAFFVWDLNRIIYGMESWWSEIRSPASLEGLSDKDFGTDAAALARLLRDVGKGGGSDD